MGNHVDLHGFNARVVREPDSHFEQLRCCPLKQTRRCNKRIPVQPKRLVAHCDDLEIVCIRELSNLFAANNAFMRDIATLIYQAER